MMYDLDSLASGYHGDINKSKARAEPRCGTCMEGLQHQSNVQSLVHKSQAFREG